MTCRGEQGGWVAQIVKPEAEVSADAVSGSSALVISFRHQRLNAGRIGTPCEQW
jgi:hypothetical protein